MQHIYKSDLLVNQQAKKRFEKLRDTLSELIDLLEKNHHGLIISFQLHTKPEYINEIAALIVTGVSSIGTFYVKANTQEHKGCLTGRIDLSVVVITPRGNITINADCERERFKSNTIDCYLGFLLKNAKDRFEEKDPTSFNGEFLQKLS